MRITTTERRHEIVQLALADGRVEVGSLAERFAVSDVTIRSDLNLLGNRGVLHRTRGGALATNKMLRELSLLQKQDDRAEIKRAIADRACAYISDGDALILDSGSTTAEVARCLGRFRNLNVMTNGLNVAMSLAANDGIDVMLTGGKLRKKSQSLFGSEAVESLSRFNFDKLVLGVDGYDFHNGISTHFEPEAVLNRRMCESAKKIIVVTDSSKFSRAGLHKIRSFANVDVVVTDSGIPETYVKAFEGSGVELAVVKV